MTFGHNRARDFDLLLFRPGKPAACLSKGLDSSGISDDSSIRQLKGTHDVGELAQENHQLLELILALLEPTPMRTGQPNSVSGIFRQLIHHLV